MQNGSVGMTKEQYYDMCDAVGSEPIDDEVPVEFEDFPEEVQVAMSIYRTLRDEWEYVSGNYLGKNLNGIFDVFDVFDIVKVDRRYFLELIHTIDAIRIEEIKKHKPK